MSISKITDTEDRQYSTLGRDIDIHRRNEDGRWDRTLEKGDFKLLKGKDCVENDITIALLTAYNELGSKGLSTYNNFGNHSYELLKENKSSMLVFKLENYFKEVINKIRRVKTVLNLEILEYNIHSFDVIFSVDTLQDVTISGEVNYSSQNVLSRTFLTLTSNPNDRVDVGVSMNLVSILTNTRGSGLPNIDVSFYSNDKLIGQSKTNSEGVASVYYNPSNTEMLNIRSVFNGDNDFHTSESELLSIPSFQYNFFQDKDGNLYLIYNDNIDTIPDFIVDDEGDMSVDTDSIKCDVSVDDDGNFFIDL
jgi:hypothetical protein